MGTCNTGTQTLPSDDRPSGRVRVSACEILPGRPGLPHQMRHNPAGQAWKFAIASNLDQITQPRVSNYDQTGPAALVILIRRANWVCSVNDNQYSRQEPVAREAPFPDRTRPPLPVRGWSPVLDRRYRQDHGNQQG